MKAVTAVLGVLGVLGLAVVVLVGQFPGGLGGRVAVADAAGHVRVWNLHGDERGRAEVRPSALVLSEAVTLSVIRWRRWAAEGAAGRGLAGGMWCLPECLTRPYRAAVTLGRVRRVGGERFYTRFTVRVAPRVRGGSATVLRGTLPIPGRSH